MKTINILWTGGLDSTYRIIELSRLNVTIQPFYILDKTRKSIAQELKAMRKITIDIKNNANTKAKLLPFKIINISDIHEDNSITKAWSILNKKYILGSQYDFLARFAKQYKLKLEVGLEKSERSKATMAIKGETTIYLEKRKLDDEIYSVYVIDAVHSSNEGALIFQDLLLPASLWNMTKLDEVEGYKKLGFEKTLKETWFCHRPIFGLPCGHCNPCKDCLNEGMAYRIPRIGFLLGGVRRLLLGAFHFIMRLNRYKKD